MVEDELQMTGKKKKKKKSKPSPPPPNLILEANLTEANLTAPPIGDFPPSLVRYLRRSFKNLTAKDTDNMEVAMRRKISAAGGTPNLWKMDWDSMDALLPLSTSSSVKDQQLRGDDQSMKPSMVTVKGDESNTAEEKNSSTISNMEGSQSSANLFLPSSHNPQPQACSSLSQTLSSPSTQPSVPQPQTIYVTRQEQYESGDKSNEVEEDFITNSYLESPHSSAKRPFSSTPYQPHVFSHEQQRQSFPHHPPKLFWRPWEEKTSETMPSLFPILPDPPLRRLIRVAKRRRSPGDLAKRKQRLFDHQKNQFHPIPHTPEPEQSRLESGSWAGEPLRLDWTWSGGSSDFREDPPSPPESWWSSPSPSLPTSPPWLTSNMAPPSPVFCDGCQRWGNLLSVTVSQTTGL